MVIHYDGFVRSVFLDYPDITVRAEETTLQAFHHITLIAQTLELISVYTELQTQSSSFGHNTVVKTKQTFQMMSCFKVVQHMK